jgi:hypothetical protein
VVLQSLTTSNYWHAHKNKKARVKKKTVKQTESSAQNKMQETKFDIFGQTVDIKEHIANTQQTGTKIWTSVRQIQI